MKRECIRDQKGEKRKNGGKKVIPPADGLRVPSLVLTMTIVRKDTKILMAESIKELAEKKPLSKIHVSDITKNCQMSTSSFYHHFSDKYELVSYILNSEIDGRISTADIMSLRMLYSTILDILDEEHKFYENVLASTLIEYPNHAFFHAALDGKIRNLIKSRCMSKPISDDLELTLSVYLAGVTAAMCRYITARDLNRSELIKAFIVAIPDKLKPIMIVS